MDIQNRDFIALKWDDGRRSNFHLLHLRSWCLCSACQHSTGQRLVNSADIAPSQDIDDIFRTNLTSSLFVFARSLHSNDVTLSLSVHSQGSNSEYQVGEGRSREHFPLGLAT